MGKPRLLNADPEGRRSQWYHDMGDDGFVIETKVDSKPLIEENAAKFNSVSDWGPSRWNPKGAWGRHTARVPVDTAYQELMYRDPLDGSYKFRDEAFIKAWMNDKDKRVWRVIPGRV